MDKKAKKDSPLVGIYDHEEDRIWHFRPKNNEAGRKFRAAVRYVKNQEEEDELQTALKDKRMEEQYFSVLAESPGPLEAPIPDTPREREFVFASLKKRAEASLKEHGDDPVEDCFLTEDQYVRCLKHQLAEWQKEDEERETKRLRK